MPQFPTTLQSKPPSPTLTSCKQKNSQGNQLISRALDLDEEINAANGKIDKTRLVGKANTVLKLYLDGGEILKNILSIEPNKLPR